MGLEVLLIYFWYEGGQLFCGNEENQFGSIEDGTNMGTPNMKHDKRFVYLL
jgi:hypothetical protein